MVRKVLKATGLPVIVFARPGRVDNELLVAVAEEAKVRRSSWYLRGQELPHDRRRSAIARASGQLPHAHGCEPGQATRYPDQGYGAAARAHPDGSDNRRLGYGIEYGYSVMERLRLAALQATA